MLRRPSSQPPVEPTEDDFRSAAIFSRKLDSHLSQDPMVIYHHVLGANQTNVLGHALADLSRGVSEKDRANAPSAGLGNWRIEFNIVRASSFDGRYFDGVLHLFGTIQLSLEPNPEGGSTELFLLRLDSASIRGEQLYRTGKEVWDLIVKGGQKAKPNANPEASASS